MLETADTTIARTRWSLSPQTGGRYVSTSRTEPAGVFALISGDTRVERSEWTYAGDWLQPLAYHYEQTGRKARKIGITFDWRERRPPRVTGRGRGSCRCRRAPWTSSTTCLR